jgi:membrane-associated phospholipid phosphatase
MKKTKKTDKIKMHTKQQLMWLLWTTIIMIIGLILFKYIPMHLYGKDILFDASSHVAWTTWGLYILWFFVAPKKSWRIPYFIFSAMVLTVMGIQRIIAGAHNLVGVILGLAIAVIAIVAPRWNEFRKGVYF